MYRAPAHHELLRDLGVRQLARQQAQDLELASGERRQRAVRSAFDRHVARGSGFAEPATAAAIVRERARLAWLITRRRASTVPMIPVPAATSAPTAETG